MPPNLPDVTSAPIQNNREYVAAVLVLGTGNQQLSAFSTPLKLKNQGIYNGRYFVYYFDRTCIWVDGIDRGIGNSLAYIHQYVDLELIENEYSGLVIDPDEPLVPTLGVAKITVDGTKILNYSKEWTSTRCGWIIENGCIEDGFCDYSEQGEGNIIDELKFEIIYTDETCVYSCEGTRIFQRVRR